MSTVEARHRAVALGLAVALGAGSAASAQPSCRGELGKALLEEAYLGVLARWSAGDEDAPAALADLFQLVVDEAAGFRVEDASVDRLPRFEDDPYLPGSTCFAAVEKRLVADLAERRPASLTAILALDLTVFQEQVSPPYRLWMATYFDRQALWLARESRAWVLESSERALHWLALGETRRASSVMRWTRSSATAFARAASLEPERIAGRFAEAFVAEKLDDLRSARSQLRRLSQRWPDDSEILLRAALVDLRSGRERPGRRLLEQLLAQPSPPAWVEIVASQELARALSASSPERAVAVLERAMDRHPTDPQLRILLASLIPHDPQRLAQTLAPIGQATAHGEELTPRVRYERLRHPDFVAAMETFGQRVTAALPELAAALDERESALRGKR